MWTSKTVGQGQEKGHSAGYVHLASDMIDDAGEYGDIEVLFADGDLRCILSWMLESGHNAELTLRPTEYEKVRVQAVVTAEGDDTRASLEAFANQLEKQAANVRAMLRARDEREDSEDE
jgi:hypothetical protein